MVLVLYGPLSGLARGETRQLVLFRVLQEATVNAVVQSAASEVWVSLRSTAAEIRLRIDDRGVGVDAECAVRTAGLAWWRSASG